MRVGLIGVGVVGGTLLKWFQNHTNHEIACYDPNKEGMRDHKALQGSEAVFIAVPVPASGVGQDLKALKDAAALAKHYCVDREKIFVRSTVLPGTNDQIGTCAMPEFLTERTAYEDFCRLPILLGKAHKNTRMDGIFPDKELIFMSNTEAELAKFTHNCFGAIKVTYFNIIKEMCDKLKCDYEQVRAGMLLSKHIDATHTLVPGPDKLHGYGGRCFPENMDAFTRYLFYGAQMQEESKIFKDLIELNRRHRERGQL